jgi:ribosomal-protein-serine acetyltransferase
VPASSTTLLVHWFVGTTAPDCKMLMEGPVQEGAYVFTTRVDDDLELRLLQARNAQALFQLVDSSRDDLRTWLGWVDGVRSVADIQTFIRAALQDFADSRRIVTGIWHQGALVGVIELHAMPGNTSGEIGYWLAPAARGQGLMTRATRALVDHGFRELRLHRIQIRCATGNRASRAVPERLGFALEGVVREAEWVNDHYNDLAIYAMLQDSWQGR